MSQLSLNSSLDVSPTVSRIAFAKDTSNIKFIKIMAYSILVTSFLGNIVIISTVVRSKRMHTTITDYLIANMAASDLLISTFAVPIKLSEIVVGPRRWLIDGIRGSISCKLGYFFQDTSTAVSTLSLVVIAIDRYGGILFPFRPPTITRKRCKVIIALVWLLSMGLHSIYFYTYQLVSANTNKTKCDWSPDFGPQEVLEPYMIVLFSFLPSPFPVLTVIYSQIVLNLRKERIENGSLSTISRKRNEGNVKAMKNICTIMVAFVFCVLPLYIYGTLCFFVWKLKMPRNIEQLGFAVHFVLFSNSAITPLIYFVFNDRYRKGLIDILRGLRFWYKLISTMKWE